MSYVNEPEALIQNCLQAQLYIYPYSEKHILEINRFQ